MKTTQLIVKGMHCVNCAKTAERMLSKVPGVQEAHVDFTSGKARVIHDASVAVNTLADAVADAGYEAVQDEEQDSETEDPLLHKERNNLIIAWVIALPLMLTMIFMYIWNVMIIPMHYTALVSVAGSLAVLVFAGKPVVKATLFSFKTLIFTMDSLIGIGSIAALLSGILNLFKVPIENFSVLSAMIIAINNTGNYIKIKSTKKAGDAIRKLANISAKTAHKIVDGVLVDIPSKLLVPGDIVFVKPGETIPSDGIIIKGSTAIDESLATGESIPVDKTEGSNVIGGTINQTGAIEVKIDKTGSDTFIASVIKLIEDAQASKIPIQQLADKVTNIFVPVILILSALSFAFWLISPKTGWNILEALRHVFPFLPEQMTTLSMALFSSIATLVIACPCALGLATPTALMVGISMGAQNGILIRKGEAIQTIKDATIVVFDKTGTITNGRPEVINCIPFYKKEFFTTSYLLEKNSEHPLAHAIAEYSYKTLLSLSASKETLDKELQTYQVNGFLAKPGMGAEAILNGSTVYAGTLSFLSSHGVQLNSVSEIINKYNSEPVTIVGVANNTGLLGIFTLGDSLKPDTPQVIQALNNLGLKTMLLSGDNTHTATNIASLAGISEVKAELSPQDKIDEIKKLQGAGHTVIMVGDGINDAPALKQADVGIAIGTGTDIAMDSADIILVQGKLHKLLSSITLSRALFNKIKQNLFWAFFYNLVAIPLAMLGMLNPIIAESAMALSSISVVSNSLKLRRLKLF